MVIDVADTINKYYHQANIISFTPTYSHVIYRATLELISFRDDMDKAEWTGALETLREATWIYGRRWQAAGKCLISSHNDVLLMSRLAKHLRSVDSVLSNLSDLPSTFNTFQPAQNDPFLVTLLST